MLLYIALILTALACINTIRGYAADYCSPYFRTEAWKLTFSGIVHPIPSMQLWPIFPDDELLQVPLAKRQPGRPKKHRNRAEGDGRPVTTRSHNVTCKICGGRGHN